MSVLAKDVLQEVKRDVLTASDPLGLDRLLVGRGRQFDGGAHGVIGLR
jgi:hypothetical protein